MPMVNLKVRYFYYRNQAILTIFSVINSHTSDSSALQPQLRRPHYLAPFAMKFFFAVLAVAASAFAQSVSIAGPISGQNLNAGQGATVIIQKGVSSHIYHIANAN